MTLDQARIGHSVAGRTYLAEKGTTMQEHRVQCRRAYGDLRGVQFHDFPAGTKFSSGPLGHYWVKA